MLDVHDVKELLNLKCLRFAERLFATIDVKCDGFISVEDLSDFVYAFENNHIQSRLYMIFHCYDARSRGHLTVPEIKTMFMASKERLVDDQIGRGLVQENFIEGGCKIDHRMVECVTECVLAQIKAQDSLVSYHQLMEVMMYHPHLLCHLMKSKIPSKPPQTVERYWQTINDASVDYSGQLLSLSLFVFVLIIVFSTGLLRNRDDPLVRVLGWSQHLADAASDLFKVTITFLVLTFCACTPFLYRSSIR